MEPSHATCLAAPTAGVRGESPLLEGRSLTGKETVPCRKREGPSQEEIRSLAGGGLFSFVPDTIDSSRQTIRHACHGGATINKIRYELSLEGIKWSTETREVCEELLVECELKFQYSSGRALTRLISRPSTHLK